ncbi:glycosyltransferase [Candidatus Binatia bacterium]|nr:glycosyltransferase [Candidatus Binatia bacterium]
MPSLQRGDATGNDALGMHAALVSRGWDVRLFAEGGDRTLGFGTSSEARSFLRDGAAALFHQGTQWDNGVRIFERASGVRIARDHNVTPASFFAGVSDDFVGASNVGLAQRERLARDPSIAWIAASAMNAGELVALGASAARVAVVPPFHQAEELAAVEPDEAALRRWVALPADVLFVGRLAPNKGHRRLLRIAATYAELFGRRLRIRLVGSHDRRWAPWLALLARDREQLRLGDSIEYLGTLSTAELKAAYLTSRMLLCCSEHEGFCVPLVEAGRLGVPVVATWQQAVAETLGPDALVLRDADDDVVATAVHRVLEDGTLRDALVAAQQARYATRYAPAAIERAFLAAVEPLLRAEPSR